MKTEKYDLWENFVVLSLNIIVLKSFCLCYFRNLLQLSSTKKLENGLVSWGVATEIRGFLVQTPIIPQMGLGTQPHYKTPGNLQVSEAGPSRMTQKLPIESQIAVKKTWIFFWTYLKGIVHQILKWRNVTMLQ